MASNRLAPTARKSLAMGPSVRNLLSHYQLDPLRITSTGPHQTLIKCDVVDYITQHNLQPVKSGQQQRPTSMEPNQTSKPYTSNLDVSGYQHKPGPEGWSKIAKELLKS